MHEAIENSKEELKRADHLIYVSLKYTRTCDIFKNIIERLINALEFALDAILKKLEEENKIMEIPSQPGIKCSLLKETINDEELNKILDFYLLLRQLNRADFSRAREFRRHVTMTLCIVDKEHEINIDIITDYYKNTIKYVEYIQEKFIQGVVSD